MLTDTLLLYLQGISTVQILDINTDAIIHASSDPSLDLVVESYATQLSTIWLKLLIVS